MAAVKRNSSMVDYATNGLLHESFIRQAKLSPEKVAVVEASGRSLTFAELDTLSDTLAMNLRLKGVEPDRCVGIYMDKCIEYVVAYIGILKAGGAYLPLDISYPDTLMENILSDANPVVVLSKNGLQEKVKGFNMVVSMEDGWETVLDKENKSSKVSATPPTPTLDNLAYIVYSSGTTGKPKGIMCPHRGAVFSYHSRHEFYPYKPEDREACNVFFVWEMLRPLLKGIPLYIIPSNTIYDPPLLCQYLHDNQITRMLFTPSLLEAVLNAPDINFEMDLKTMKTIVFCGEVVTTALYEKCAKLLPWVRFVNLYSVSECHDVACEDLNQYFKTNEDALKSRKFCPVGKVIPGVHIIILDEALNLQPVGSPGEIYVGGPTLARGYLNRPEIQAKRFIPRPEGVPASCGEVLYRSGDWGYMLSDGRLEICGRCDSMVKIRGYSIEIQAVEVALMELPMVHSCVVIVKGEEGEDKFLVSYIVPKVTTTKKEVRDALKKRIPFYMIPSYIVFLTKIPVVQATGKLDKAALPPFDVEAEDDVINEGKPTTETEVAIAKVWCKILQMKAADITESFFDLGGHSLLAAELISSINKTFSIKLSVQELFSYPTIASLASLVDSKLSKEPASGPAVEQTKVDLMEEVAKYDMGIINIDMQLRAFWRMFAFYNERRFEKGLVLLTGATGFLGSFLLRELLIQTKVFVFCLCRELPDTAPLERVRNSLIKHSILAREGSSQTEQQKQLEQMFIKRVTALKGDVALVNLGLSDEDYAYVSSDVDMVIHAGASVNLVYPYNALSGANVQGTSNIITFACTGKVKPIHYISTDAVFPTGLTKCAEQDDATSYHTQLEDGYSQTKWVAEQLMRRAAGRGLPVAIYRLGNMSGDSQSAAWNAQDFTLLVLQACVSQGKAPDVKWPMEMTPVDFATKFIVAMTKRSTLCLGKTLHVLNDTPLQSRWVFEWMTAHGYPMQIVPFNEWRESLLKNKGDNSGLLHRLLESYITDTSFFTSLSTYTAEEFHKALTQLGMSYPYLDGNQLERYCTQLSARGVLAPKRYLHSTGKSLQGKVAIVTGASSGIGQAIAETLAANGAKVAMAARRVERLQEMEKKIAGAGGVAIAVKCDVVNRAEVEELVRHTEMTLGPVDILVNNAGTMFYTMMKNVHLQEWDTMIDVNVKGLTNCISAVVPKLVDRGQGHIVNMSSDAGRKGFPGLAVYSGTKFYVEGLSQALRHEMSGLGVRVTCIQPGDVKTELLNHNTDTEAKDQFDGSTSHKILDPCDIANAVLYAVTQPDHVGVNEILIEPRQAPI